VFVFFLTGCSVKPFLSNEESLVEKNNVKIVQENADAYEEAVPKTDIHAIVRPRANTKFLGTRLPQYIYLSLAAKPDSSSFRNFLQNQFGQEPIFVDTVLMERSLTNIQNYLFNNGYFNGNATYSVEQKDSISSVINYTVFPNTQHTFGIAKFEFADSTIKNDVLGRIDLEDYINEGDAFDVNDLNALRDNMVKNALERGYYDFTKSSIYVEQDTLRADKVSDIYVVVDNERDTLYNRKYYIRDVYMKLGQGINDSYLDPEEYNGKQFSQSENVKVKPKVLDRFILLEDGETYSRTKHLNTINKLYDLPIVRYANMEFQRVLPEEPLNEGDSLFLDVFIDANAKKPMNLSLEPTISEFEGPALGLDLGLEHRNIFGGGEVFDFGISGSLQSVNNAENNNDIFGTKTIEVEPSLVFPRLLLLEDIFTNTYTETVNQRTTLSTQFGYQDYVDLYDLTSFGISQTWEFQSSPHNKHILSLFDISFVKLDADSLYLDRIAPFPSIRFSLEDRLIFSTNYTYSYTNRLKKEENENYFNFRGTVDFSGNMLSLLSGADTTKIFGQPVSQYVRGLSSFTYYTPVYQDKVQWVNHLQAGAAIPTDENFKNIPAVKQFFLGGSSSMRAWRPRALGPGSFEGLDDELLNIDQRGDLMLEFNSELRYPVTTLFGLPLNGALFTDMGNVWAYEEPEVDGRPGAEFSSDDFLREIGIGAGTGLRLDIDFLVVRTDFAWKLRDPSLPEGERWVNNPLKWNKLQFQLGIGYPFEN